MLTNEGFKDWFLKTVIRAWCATLAVGLSIVCKALKKGQLKLSECDSC